MVKNNGVSPAGPGHSAEPGPISVVPADTASVPNAWPRTDEEAMQRPWVTNEDQPRVLFVRGTAKIDHDVWVANEWGSEKPLWIVKRGGAVCGLRPTGTWPMIHAQPAASAIDARRAATTGAVHESATEGDAQTGGSNG